MPKRIKDENGKEIGVTCCGTDHIGDESVLNHIWMWHNPDDLSREEMDKVVLDD